MTGTRTDAEPDSEPDSGRPLSRRLRPAPGDLVALGYLAVCAGLLIWAFVVSSGDGPDASVAGVIPLLATAPVSFVVLVLPDDAAMLFVVGGIALGALANAALIAWCGRALRRGDRQDPDPDPDPTH